MNAFQWQLGMQVLNCLEIEDFIDCFGEQKGRWIWAKHVGQYKNDTIGFICYLDMGNCKKLHDFIMARVEKMTPSTEQMFESIAHKLINMPEHEIKELRDKQIKSTEPS